MNNYFDHAASHPPFQEAMDTFVKVSKDYFGNPSSAHEYGTKARSFFNKAKNEFCTMLNFNDGRLLLTSGGTESNNLVVRGFLKTNPRARLLIAEDVHPSIWWVRQTFKNQCDILPLPPNGHINLAHFRKYIHKETSFFCMSHVCNETGFVHDVEKISQYCGQNGIQMLCDGVQAIGHIPVNMKDIRCNYYTFSAHKFGGPRGVGGTLLRNATIEPVFGGGKQEWNLRPGTENIAGMASMVTALKCSRKILQDAERLRCLSKKLYKELKSDFDCILLNSDLMNGLPGLLSISIPGIKSQIVVAEMDVEGFASSAGSACHSEQVTPSRIILAMGRNQIEAMGTLRVSLGIDNQEKDVELFCNTLIRVIKPNLE